MSAPSRRGLLKLLGAGGVFLLAGGWLYRTLGRFGPPASGLRVLDVEEAQVVDALCEAFFPGPPQCPLTAKEVELTRFVDAYLGGLYDDVQTLFRTLLHAFDAATLPTHRARFHALPLADRQEVLETWRTSRLRTRSTLHQVLSLPVKMGYFEDDRVRAAGGLEHGCDLSAHPGPKGIL